MQMAKASNEPVAYPTRLLRAWLNQRINGKPLETIAKENNLTKDQVLNALWRARIKGLI